MYPELLNHYALHPLNLQLIITFALMVRFEHMIHHLNHLNLKICLIIFSCRSDGQKHCWFKTLIQARCALSVFRILICKNSSLCEGQNVGSKMGCQQFLRSRMGLPCHRPTCPLGGSVGQWALCSFDTRVGVIVISPTISLTKVSQPLRNHLMITPTHLAQPFLHSTTRMVMSAEG